MDAVQQPRPGETVREYVTRGGRFDNPGMPEEDLITPEHLLHVPQQLAGRGVVDAVLAAALDLSPRARVRLGTTAAMSMLLARSRMPALAAVLAAVGAGYMAERLYVVVHDVHQAAIVIRDLEATPGELRRPGGKRAAQRDKGRDKAENDKRCPVVR